MDQTEKGMFNEKDDIYIGTYYVSPYNKNNKLLDFFTALNDEVSYFKRKGVVLVQGDF